MKLSMLVVSDNLYSGLTAEVGDVGELNMVNDLLLQTFSL